MALVKRHAYERALLDVEITQLSNSDSEAENLMDLWKINAPYNLMRLMYEHKPFNDCSLILCLIIWCAL